MGRLIPDLLRAVADGWEQAAGRDPVDEHAAEAVELLDLDQTAANVRVGPVQVFRLWPDGVSDEEKVAILERELLRVALERDRLAKEAFGPIPATTEDRSDDPDEVVVTTDVDEDLVIQLGLDLQEARREIEALQAQLAEQGDTVTPLVEYTIPHADAALREQLRVSVALGYPVRWSAAYVAAIRDLVERLWESSTVVSPDPADTAKVDDRLPLVHGEWCGSTTEGDGFNGQWHCSRSPHTTGQHVATTAGTVVAVWPNESDTPRDVQAVVDAARTYAELYAGERAKYCVEPSARALVDAVRALDGQPLLSAATRGEVG